jgi:hypothetical protein
MLGHPVANPLVDMLLSVPAIKLCQSDKDGSVAILEEQDCGQLIFGPSLRFDYEPGGTLVLSQGLQDM